MESAGPIVKGMIHQEQNVSFKGHLLVLFASLFLLV